MSRRNGTRLRHEADRPLPKELLTVLDDTPGRTDTPAQVPREALERAS